MLFTIPSSNSSFINCITDFCVDTSNADVGSSAATTTGFINVDIATTTLCFIPPLNSNGYRFNTLEGNDNDSKRFFVSSIISFSFISGSCSFIKSITKSFIFMVGFKAFIAL